MLKTIVFLCLAAFAVGSSEPLLTSQRYPTVGDYVDSRVDGDDVLAAANHAAKSLPNLFNSTYHHRVLKVYKAQTQVVNGFNYRLDVIFGQTTCKKSEVNYEQVEDCEFAKSVKNMDCQVVVYKNLKGELELKNSKCVSRNL